MMVTDIGKVAFVGFKHQIMVAVSRIEKIAPIDDEDGHFIQIKYRPIEGIESQDAADKIQYNTKGDRDQDLVKVNNALITLRDSWIGHLKGGYKH